MHGLSTTQLGIDPLLPLQEQPGIAELLAYLWQGLSIAVVAVAGYIMAPNCQYAVSEPAVLENISRSCMQNSLQTAA